MILPRNSGLPDDASTSGVLNSRRLSLAKKRRPSTHASAQRKEILQLKRLLAEKAMEVYFLKGALQKVEARRVVPHHPFHLFRFTCTPRRRSSNSSGDRYPSAKCKRSRS